MPRTTRVESAYQPEGPNGCFYRHIAADCFASRDWTPDENWRLVLHAEGCPRLADEGTCECARVDIKMLRPKGDS